MNQTKTKTVDLSQLSKDRVCPIISNVVIVPKTDGNGSIAKIGPVRLVPEVVAIPCLKAACLAFDADSETCKLIE